MFAELLPRRDRRLRAAEGVPGSRCVDPGAGELADDDRQPRAVEIAAHVAHQARQVLLVGGHGAVGVDAVVPAVPPHEARQLAARRAGNELRHRRERLLHLGDHPRVIRPRGRDVAALLVLGGPCRRRAEVGEQALAPPCRLHQQHRLAARREVIADDLPEGELGAEVMGAAVDGVTDPEGAGQQRLALADVADEDAVTGAPGAVGVPQPVEPRRVRGMGEQRREGSLAAVVVLAGKIRDRLPLHVRLAGEHEDASHRARSGPVRADLGRERDDGGEGHRQQANGKGHGGNPVQGG